jgi:hypothetical protein
MTKDIYENIRMDTLYSSNLILCLMPNGFVRLLKSRVSEPKYLTTNELIDILSTLLAKVKFKGTSKIFEEGMKQQLEEAIHNIVDS